MGAGKDAIISDFLCNDCCALALFTKPGLHSILTASSVGSGKGIEFEKLLTGLRFIPLATLIISALDILLLEFISSIGYSEPNIDSTSSLFR